MSEDLPQWTPTARELDDLDLLVGRRLAPLRHCVPAALLERAGGDRPAALIGFVDPASAGAAAAITLAVDSDVADRALAAGGLTLIDPEGAPLAWMQPIGSWPGPEGRTGLVGPVEQVAHNAFGPFRRLHVTPARLHETEAPSSLLAVAVRRPLTRRDLADIDEAARDLRRTALLIACVGDGMPTGLSGPALVRATRAAAGHLDQPSVVVAVSVADHGDPEANRWLLAGVCAAYADETLALPESPPEAKREPPVADGWAELPDDVAAIVSQDRPPRDRQGVVFFFTGLSGSGKSTLARALTDHLLERGERTVTSLDGDVVRHHLSKGLGFSREDRETNILRIGFVAAEISRHGGVAICSPIAPFAATREAVREMVERAGGGFVLIHVATPLEECERRDRKGLYARARAGLIPDFTGISSPYEEPTKSLKVDTTDRDIAECLAQILDALANEGWLRN
jgi:sulfate adenylyltransferase